MTHDERVWHHEMETCEGIHEHAERIAALEELVLDAMVYLSAAYGYGHPEYIVDAARELGIEDA